MPFATQFSPIEVKGFKTLMLVSRNLDKSMFSSCVTKSYRCSYQHVVNSLGIAITSNPTLITAQIVSCTTGGVKARQTEKVEPEGNANYYYTTKCGGMKNRLRGITIAMGIHI